TYPGRVVLRSHLSELPPSGTTCTSATDSGCAGTEYSWNLNGTLTYVQRFGNSYNTSANKVAASIYTYFTYDAQGRVTQVKSKDDVNRVVYEYWSSTDPLLD